MSQPQWTRASVGYRVMQGGYCNAVIIPVRPHKGNNYARWLIDHLRNGRSFAARLADAKNAAMLPVQS